MYECHVVYDRQRTIFSQVCTLQTPVCVACVISASEMTYSVSSGALNSTHSPACVIHTNKLYS